MAQAQAEATREAQRAGIAHAKGNGDRTYLGRKPSYTRDQFQSARGMLGQQAGIAQIAKATGLTRQTIYRIKDDPAGSERALASSGLCSRRKDMAAERAEGFRPQPQERLPVRFSYAVSSRSCAPYLSIAY
jgi:hypothetical protein